MDVVEDSAKREALAQRMAKLLGLPITNIQLLMPLISTEDLNRLEALPDDQFLSQATKIINAAQKRQFSEMDSGDGDSGSAAPAAPPPATATGEPKTLKRKSLGLKSQSSEPEAEASDDVGPAVGESQTGVKVVDSSASEMPAAFKRPVKKEGVLSDKKVVFALVAGGVGALVLVVLAIIFVVSTFSTPAEVEQLTELPILEEPVERPPETVAYDNKWALKMDDTFYLEVGTGEISGPLTVEFWVRPQAGEGKQEVLVTGEGGGEETFRLILRRLEGGNYEAEFAVPTARREAAVFSFPDSLSGKWLHLAGVYDPSNTGQIFLFAGGRLVAQAPSAEVPDMVTSSYRVISTVSGATEGFLIDEVRLTNVASYVNDFEPERFLDVLSDTQSLLHLEKWDDGMVMDAAADNKKIEVPKSVTFVALADEPEAPIYTVELAPIEFPKAILARLLEVSGQEHVDAFMAEWNKKSRSERISYLETIGIPKEEIEKQKQAATPVEPPPATP